MIEEYDRTISASPLKPSRLRLFLFPSKPETAASMGSLLDDAKSETWFVDALNGAGLFPRGLSESAAMDSLLELDDGMVKTDSCADLEAQNESLGNHNKQVEGKSNAQEVVLDSPPMVETTSSFGSSSSTPSMANLPPIKVRVEDYQMVGLDEQFSHVSIASSLANAAAPSLLYGGGAAAKSGGGVCGENVGRVICEDEKSEKSENGTVAPTGLRKPPLPLQPVQRKLVDIHNLPSPDSKHAGGHNLPSPDSVASDCSVASAGSLSKHTFYQDGTQLINRENRLPTPTPIPDQKISNNNNIQEPTSQVQQNQQFIHPNTPYIQHPPMPISSYYPHPMYLQQHHTDHPQYPMYLLPPLTQNQPSYDAPMVPSARPLTPPVYPSKPEMYPTGATGATPVLVQVPPHHFQQQYINLSQIPPPPQTNATVVSAPGVNYGYEYSHHVQDQGYYSTAPPPPHYQSLSPAAAVMLSQATSTVADNASQQL
ncbi:hypothetical protein CDL12_09457 [Handroanthus impetiginosus]|uniref:Uncharacterized protein n=1 Tax=Handroanthus impetiginosus TaxID=429701 RepID=A0A2G9HK48_9LAMI|nr:hypothetical protein CDL12_09457 [Handroanthus impetiginosus]